MAEQGLNNPGLARMDSGRDVPRPHEPQPLGQDNELLMNLQEQNDRAQQRLEAHRAELSEQVAYHEQEIERAQRVIAACESAAGQLGVGKDQPASIARPPGPIPFAGEAPGFA